MDCTDCGLEARVVWSTSSRAVDHLLVGFGESRYHMEDISRQAGRVLQIIGERLMRARGDGGDDDGVAVYVCSVIDTVGSRITCRHGLMFNQRSMMAAVLYMAPLYRRYRRLYTIETWSEKMSKYDCTIRMFVPLWMFEGHF